MATPWPLVSVTGILSGPVLHASCFSLPLKPFAFALVPRETLSGQVGLGGRMMGLAWVLDKPILKPKGPGGRVSTPGGSSSSLVRPLICVARPGTATAQSPSRKKTALAGSGGAQISASPQAGQSSPSLSTQQADLPSGAHHGTRLLGGTKVLGWAQGSGGGGGAGSCWPV